MKQILALLLGLLAFRSHAQAPAPAVPDSAIHVTVLQQGRYASVVYTVRHEPLTPATLKALLKRYPPAAAELRKGRAQTRWALALLPVMVAALLVGKQQAHGPGSKFSDAPVPISILLGAFVGYGYLLLSNTHFDTAIEVYNRQFH